ncbi:MarR family winged helix-turn-helix transcriptional regulator [Altericroceibacterium xinjiangense]|uniref:MarR family winged helix-turn-helix transcriptional regulator n=1 Tax=Altericroceibacterium xinjiangense TaxID=762261 RepID=UPI001F49866B|nr:MarR family transcriptional regulator [Altericroceibacterium xinjiangense]
MIEGYAGLHGVPAATIAEGLVIMRRASLMIRRLESYFADCGLSQLRFLFLIVIDREPDRDSLTVGEITERLDVAGPVVARTLRVLVDDGLVTAERDADDARTKHVRLTAAGRERLTALLPGYFAIIADEMENPL